MSEDKLSVKIPHFDGQYYDHWRKLIENLIHAKGLWSSIERGFEEPSVALTLTEQAKKKLEIARINDHKVKHYLFQAIERYVFEQILDRRTSKSVWDSLKMKFGGNIHVRKSLLNSLRRDFEVLEMKETESITEYFARVMTMANNMMNNGEEIPDSKVVQKILRTLTDVFTYVVVSMEESNDIE